MKKIFLTLVLFFGISVSKLTSAPAATTWNGNTFLDKNYKVCL